MDHILGISYQVFHRSFGQFEMEQEITSIKQSIVSNNHMSSATKQNHRQFGQPNWHIPAVSKIFEAQPINLSEKEKRILYEEIARSFRRVGNNSMKIGSIISFITRHSAGATKSERKAEFEAKLKLSYGTAMKMKRVFEFYQNSPQEVWKYGIDASDRLRIFQEKKKRLQVWRRTGTCERLKQYLRSIDSGQKRKTHRVIMIPNQINSPDKPYSTDLGGGIRFFNYENFGTLRIDFRKADQKKVFRALSSITGSSYKFIDNN